MRRIALPLLLLLTLSGCASAPPFDGPVTSSSDMQPTETTPPAPITVDEDTESAYVEILAEPLPEGMDTPENREALLSFGYSICENAREYEITTGEAAQEHIDTLDTTAPEWSRDMALALLAGKHAGALLCPKYAGSAG